MLEEFENLQKQFVEINIFFEKVRIILLDITHTLRYFPHTCRLFPFISKSQKKHVFGNFLIYFNVFFQGWKNLKIYKNSLWKLMFFL